MHGLSLYFELQPLKIALKKEKLMYFRFSKFETWIVYGFFERPFQLSLAA